MDATRDALGRFREKTRAAGFPGLHLNAVAWGITITPGETTVRDPADLVSTLGFDSVTSYVWIHHVSLSEFPRTGYRQVMEGATEHWRASERAFHVPYFPNVTMGWDAGPRTVQSDQYTNTGYPFMPTISGNTPEVFAEALLRGREFLKNRPVEQRILTINAWNEWTEGSYLEPDTVHGMGYLEAIKAVFR